MTKDIVTKNEDDSISNNAETPPKVKHALYEPGQLTIEQALQWSPEIRAAIEKSKNLK